MRRLVNPSNDPFYNLAFEEYAFRHLEGSAFWLWVNRPVIVVGRNQDTLAEIDERYVREHGIDVVRRLSGGGAVYHDYGNLNYTILSDSDDVGFDFKRFARPVVDALASMGVKAEFSGRNDITIDGKKMFRQCTISRCEARFASRGDSLRRGSIGFVGGSTRKRRQDGVQGDRIGQESRDECVRASRETHDDRDVRRDDSRPCGKIGGTRGLPF